VDVAAPAAASAWCELPSAGVADSGWSTNGAVCIFKSTHDEWMSIFFFFFFLSLGLTYGFHIDLEIFTNHSRVVWQSHHTSIIVQVMCLTVGCEGLEVAWGSVLLVVARAGMGIEYKSRKGKCQSQIKIQAD
jgi:hypothetical protein